MQYNDRHNIFFLFQYRFQSTLQLKRVTLCAWFHGKGVQGGTRPIMYLHWPGSWNYDAIGIFAGYPGHEDKLVVYVRSHGQWAGAYASTQVVDFDRWTHLAVTFDKGSRE